MPRLEGTSDSDGHVSKSERVDEATGQSQRLPWACVPKQVFLLDRLPVNSTGKVMRQELAELLDQRSTGTGA